jgi:rhodanese-related sulfurtransferase
LSFIDQIAVQEPAAERAANPDHCIADVRRRVEWEQGHIPGARFHPLIELRNQMGSLDPNRPTG